MANESNTVGFTGCPAHQEVWRKQAARQAAAERVDELFEALVDAYAQTFVLSTYDHDEATREQAHYEDGIYEGLVQAYALLTGSDRIEVADRVAEAAAARVPS